MCVFHLISPFAGAMTKKISVGIHMSIQKIYRLNCVCTIDIFCHSADTEAAKFNFEVTFSLT